jgi:hypothetical protein
MGDIVMGTWGYKLYDDDIAADIKESFDVYLERDDYDCEKVTQRILAEYKEELDDDDDAPVIWFALADLQWKNGMLLDYVKEKAISYIDSGADLRKWEELPKQCEKRKQILGDLKTKLLSEQPPRKKKKVKKAYECTWQIGDTFAYPLLSEEAKYNCLDGRYLILIKVGESFEYGNGTFHKSPVFTVKLTKGTDLPKNKDEIDDSEYIIITSRPRDLTNLQSEKIVAFNLTCITTSKRVVPKDLIYIGNYQDLKEPDKNDDYSFQCVWKFFEMIVLGRYNMNNLGNKEYNWMSISKTLKH